MANGHNRMALHRTNVFFGVFLGWRTLALMFPFRWRGPTPAFVSQAPG